MQADAQNGLAEAHGEGGSLRQGAGDRDERGAGGAAGQHVGEPCRGEIGPGEDMGRSVDDGQEDEQDRRAEAFVGVLGEAAPRF